MSGARSNGLNVSSNQSFVFFTADMTEQEAKDSLDLLTQGIVEIQNGNASTLRFEELYRKAYTLVLHKHGEMLYNGVETVIVTKLLSTAQKILNTNSDSLVDTIISEWEDHVTKMGMIRDILMYMDKTRCENKNNPVVYDLGLIRFLDKVLRHQDTLERIRVKLLKNIHQERCRTQPSLDRQQMRNCLRILHEVDVQKEKIYETDFEQYFIEETSNFYKKESSDKLTQSSIHDYLILVEERTREEYERANHYLDFKDSDTKRKLMRKVDAQLIYSHLEKIVQNTTSGLIVMFREDRRDDLSRLYRLCEAVDRRAGSGFDKKSEKSAVGRIGKHFKDFVFDQGKAIVDDPENRQNPKRFVIQVLELLDKHNRQVEECFDNQSGLAVKLTETFVAFINKDMCAAKYLSMYVDSILRTHANGSDEDVNKALDEVMILFKYIKDKDIFEDFYRSHITYRLLQGKMTSHDIERNMINRLRHECGCQYTSKLEGMFLDMQHSNDLEKKWKIYLRETQGEAVIDFTCKVLTTGFWPFTATGNRVRLPDEITAFKETFTDFYKNKHEGRKLTYNLSQGSADLLVEFDQGRKELGVNTYQMCILMLFNRKDIFTYREIKEETNIPPEELSRNILSLAHPKVKVLNKNPNNKTLDDNHQFRFNRKYKNQRYRIAVPMLKKQQKIEPNRLPPGVREQRKDRVEAAIVRIMKTRKLLQHNQLISELIKQLSSKFQPDPAFLKKRIESLIEREFLKRDANDWRTYHYLA